MKINLRIFKTCVALIFSLQLLAQDCDNTTVIDLAGPGVADWTAPATGGPFSVRITAVGAGGGNMQQIFFNNGGSGASMSGTFVVQNGQTIRAIAGDFGKDATLEGAGAGGGSGAVNCGNPSDCANGNILIIAAGGNGGDSLVGLGGLALTNGNGSGGLAGGNPGHSSDWGGGGGGLNGPGQSASGSGGQGGGQVSKTGLAPGGLGSRTQVPNDGGDGMGGGGGGGDYGAGGAGGHTGATGGNVSAAKSFNSGENQDNFDGNDGVGPSAGTVVVICLASLPIELINFKAVMPTEGSVELLWETASEKDNLGFDVERSADGSNWSTLGFIPGNGTTNIQQDYSFLDERPLAGVNYYRLQQHDADGSYEFSPMVIADVRKNETDLDVFPNPSVDGALSFRVVSQSDGNGLLEIFDWAGYKVYKEPVSLVEGTTIWPVSLATFPKGPYTARLELPDGAVQFRKIVLQ